MNKKTIAVVRVGDYTWATDTDENAILSGIVSLEEGDAASSARVVLADPRLEVANAIPLPYKKSRTPFEVWFGYGPTLTKVFHGFLASIRPGGLPGRVELYATDQAKGMRRQPKARSLGQMSAAALVEKLAGENGLSVDLSQAPQLNDLTFASVLQHGESDWDTAQRIVEAAGCRLYERNGTLFVKEVGASDDSAQVIVVEFGVNVRNGFSFTIDELTRSTTPNVQDLGGDRTFEAGFDTDAAERIVQLERTGLTLQNEDSPSYSSQAAQRAQRAQARAKELFKGNIPLDRAYPEIDVDGMAELRGFGPRFSGFWNVRSVSHDLVQGHTSISIYNGGSE
ncbi:MAG: hypothetical protein ACF8MF_06795 [Phycisphaerales bacterium JB052]